MRKLNIEEIQENRISTEEFKKAEKLPLVVVLDNVRSLYNVGSVFRTSDAYRIEKIMLCGVTATPPNNEIHKTALGAEFSVEWKFFKETTNAIDQLKSEGYKLMAIEQAEGSISLTDFSTEKNQKYAVILGNEVKGVQDEVIDLCDACLELPQFGTKHSLNVSVTAGIVIWKFWEMMRNR